MTEIKTYPYIKYIPHWFVLRLVVCAPFGIAWYICNFLAEKLEKFGDVLDDVLPQAYVEKHVNGINFQNTVKKRLSILQRNETLPKNEFSFKL